MSRAVSRWWSVALGVLLLSCLASPRTAEAVADDRAALLARAAGGERVHVIVGLALPDGEFRPEGSLPTRTAASRQRADIASAHRTLTSALAGLGVKEYANWASLPYVGLEVDSAALDALVASPLVTTLSEDRLSWPSLDSAMPHIGADATLTAGFTGAGQTVAIVDTGIDADHPFLAGRVVAEACFSASAGGVSLCPNGSTSQVGAGAADALTTQCLYGGSSICDHGTHVAGIAAGADPGAPTPAPGGIHGVAPDANVIAIQVFTRFNTSAECGGAPPCVGAWTSDTLSALNYINTTLRLTWSIAAANMSLGGGMYTSACNGDPHKAAVDNLLSNGIATVIAAGNDGWTNALGAPGCISTAVTVGSTDDPSDFVSYYSNMHAVVDLLAPGSSVTSSIPDDTYANFSGTSMATPVVTGAFAVLKDALPGATIAQLLAAMQSTGVSVTDTRSPYPSGSVTGTVKRRLQLDAAAGTFLATCGNDVAEIGEECDGLDDAVCPGFCQTPGGGGECTCITPDECESAREITSWPYSDTQDTTGTTTAPDDPILSCGSGTQPQAHSVWYSFVAPSDTVVTVDTYGSNYDTVLAALQGTCGALTLIPGACNDDFGSLQSEISFSVVGGQTYFLEVTSYSTGPGGDLVLNAVVDSPCGDGLVDGDEDCDDGNTVGGDCCSAACEYEAAGLPCASDGNVCTTDMCDGGGLCVHADNSAPCDDGNVCTSGDVCFNGACSSGAPEDCDDGDLCTVDTCTVGLGCEHVAEPLPVGLCLVAAKSQLQVKYDSDPSKHQLKWRWGNGDAFGQAQLGSPESGTQYALCVYDSTGGVASLASSIDAASGPLWVTKAPKGWSYTDKSGSSDGVQKLQLKTGTAGRAKAQLKSGGIQLPTPAPATGSEYFAQDPEVVVQLLSSEGLCLTSEFGSSTALRNDAEQFKAKTP